MYTFKVIDNSQKRNCSFPYQVELYKEERIHKIDSVCCFESDNYCTISSDVNRYPNQVKFKTPQEAIEAIKDRFSPFEAALDRINASIDKNVAAASLTLSLRIAKFRGDLFAQVINLKSR